MNNIPVIDAAQLLRRHGIRPNARLGQNFLQDPQALEAIAAAAEIRASDTVLEIGCGLGQLTPYLAARARSVIAVEVDRRLAAIAAELLKSRANVRLICADILSLSPDELGLPEGYVVAANIPYNITSPILRHLLEASVKPRRLVLTVQQEVAERICAQPPKMSILTLSVQVYGAASIIARIPAAAFHPQPKVDSAVVRIEIYEQPRIPSALLPIFFALIKAAFAQKRKMLRNNLAGPLGGAREAQDLIASAGIDPRLRAQALGFDEWERLCRLPGVAEALKPARGAR